MSFKKDIERTNKAYAPPEVRKRKIQNNDPCPCGSGRKYKYCHKPGKKRRK